MLQWTEWDWDHFPPCTPLQHKPTATNVPIPQDSFVKQKSIDDWGESHESECDLYSFENSAVYRRLNVYNWVTSVRTVSDYTGLESVHKDHAFRIVLDHL